MRKLRDYARSFVGWTSAVVLGVVGLNYVFCTDPASKQTSSNLNDAQVVRESLDIYCEVSSLTYPLSDGREIEFGRNKEWVKGSLCDGSGIVLKRIDRSHPYFADLNLDNIIDINEYNSEDRLEPDSGNMSDALEKANKEYRKATVDVSHMIKRRREIATRLGEDVVKNGSISKSYSTPMFPNISYLSFFKKETVTEKTKVYETEDETFTVSLTKPTNVFVGNKLPVRPSKYSITVARSRNSHRIFFEDDGLVFTCLDSNSPIAIEPSDDDLNLLERLAPLVGMEDEK